MKAESCRSCMVVLGMETCGGRRAGLVIDVGGARVEVVMKMG